ncbi:MAG: isopeptide-forming domain-containing fimbrial protein, partial [Lachnospiraceae bacterium]
TGGYYLVKDTKNPTVAEGQYASQTRFIVKVTGAANPTVVTAKSSVPKIEKKLKDANDSTNELTDWQDSADYDLGDIIPYKLTISLGDGIQNYKQYYLRIEDTMSNGLAYQEGSLQVTVDYDGDFDTKGDQVTISGAAFTEDTTAATIKSATGDNLGAKKYTYAIEDLFKVADKSKITSATKVVAFYSAKLTGDAVQYGKPGNPNDVLLIYSSNPNYEGTGENGPTEETPKDRNIVFTYKTDVNKYADEVADTAKLEGAEFKLYKEIKTVNSGVETFSVSEITLEKAGNVFSAKGLDDGKYILQETKAPAGYNLIVGDVSYNGATYNNAVEFTVTAAHDVTSDDPQLTELTAARTSGMEGFSMITKGTSLDTLTTDIVDKSGSVLPSTGGVGTTMFYVIGAILAAGAGVVLITRRRMAA